MTTAIADTLKGLTLGDPQVFRNLAMFPLVAAADVEPGVESASLRAQRVARRRSR